MFVGVMSKFEQQASQLLSAAQAQAKVTAIALENMMKYFGEESSSLARADELFARLDGLLVAVQQSQERIVSLTL